jgi:hypothetical protein
MVLQFGRVSEEVISKSEKNQLLGLSAIQVQLQAANDVILGDCNFLWCREANTSSFQSASASL